MRNTAIKPLIPQDEIKLINETRFIKGETLISRGLFTFKKAKKQAGKYSLFTCQAL